MARFSFTLATKNDDALLRERMRHDAMEGAISVSFRREPSYFVGTKVQGEQVQVIKCIDNKKNKLAGLGARLTLDVFINGQRQRIGYLSDLRGAPEYRNGLLLARGYHYLQGLHQADHVPLYTSLILQGNHLALRNLTKPRAGLPLYKDWGKIMTPAIHLDIKRKMFSLDGVTIRCADEASIDEVFRFIQQQYAHKQFAPFYQASDLNNGRLNGLNIDDIYVARQGDTIVGVIAAWDQSDFRQTHIEGYSLGLKVIRPFYNALATISALKPLPKKGGVVPYFYLALTAITGDDLDVFRALLSRLYNDKRQGKWHYFISGLHQLNPLSKVLDEYRSIKASGHLFTVYYPEDETYYQKLDDRIPHIEIGAI